MLENTDKAFASLIEAAKELSTQLSPEVFAAASRVAQLSAQGDLRSALIWLLISGFVSALFTGLAIFMLRNEEGSGEGVAGIFIFVGVSLIVFCISLASYTNPLNQGLAADPKLALAYKVIQHIEHQ
jgi:hypothetical protein